MLNRNDLRSGLITKRTAPIIRSKEYIKKIKQARLKLSEASNRAKTDDEPKTPPKENDKESKHDEDEEFLDVANDVNFEDDEDDAMGKSSAAVKGDESHKAVKEDKEEKAEKADKSSSDKAADTSETMNSEKGTSRRERSEKSPSKDHERSNAVDLACVHCLTKCSTVNVSLTIKL